MQLPMNELQEFEEYEARSETVEGFVFLHLTVYDWNKNTLIKLREHLDDFLKRAEDKGHAAIFMASDDKKSVKMWQMIKPCFQVVEEYKRGKTIYLGSWITGE